MKANGILSADLYLPVGRLKTRAMTRIFDCLASIDAFVAGRPEKERERLTAVMADKSIYARYRIFREEFDRTRDGRILLMNKYDGVIREVTR